MSRGAGITDIDEFPKKLKIFLVLIMFLLIFGTVGFSILGKQKVSESSFRTLQTLAFIFHQESNVLERSLEIFLALVGVFLIWWVLWSIADMILAGNLTKYLKKEYYKYKINKMENHIIIVGGGRVGEEIARLLKLQKKKSITIESDLKTISSLKKNKYIVVEGNALDEEILEKANIRKASRIILTLPETESNILMAITAKELNPKIEIHSRCENLNMISKLKKVGVELVVVPEILAADKLASDLN